MNRSSLIYPWSEMAMLTPPIDTVCMEVKKAEVIAQTFLSCTICILTWPNVDVLNAHMNIVHKETLHVKIERLTNTIQSSIELEKTTSNATIAPNRISLDCTECGQIFITNEENQEHIRKINQNKSETLTIEEKRRL